MSRRVEFGDWQTPIELAREALALLSRLGGPTPSVVLEPTCGEGSFLVAAANVYNGAKLRGYEINPAYAEMARASLVTTRSTVTTADFFTVDWERELANVRGHVLVTGNPPWVTNSVLGGLGSSNVPNKRNFKRQSGFDAMTGKSNFDVSESMLLQLLGTFRKRDATFAVLCKSAVARRVIEFAAANSWPLGARGLWRIDAMRHFHAAVDAVLFVFDVGPTVTHGTRWPVYESLTAASPALFMEVVDGTLAADVDGLERTARLVGYSEPEWRSGLKHDCSRVMELTRSGLVWTNGFGEKVTVEEEYVYPLLKSSDVANGPTGLTKQGLSRPTRAVIVTQQRIGAETKSLQHVAPKLWTYLSAPIHRDALRARKSAIYKDQPDFAIFGIGPYSFAPWKVAISGLYKSCVFALVGPQKGRPSMLDDTCYFLPFANEESARNAHKALTSVVAADFFAARVFLDAKRPVNKAILQKLDLNALLAELGLDIGPRAAQQRLAI